jgi:hypothetical protein
MQGGAAKPAAQPSAAPATAKPAPSRQLPTMAAAASATAADIGSQQRQQPQHLRHSQQDRYPASYTAGQYPLFPHEPAFAPYTRAEEQFMRLLLTDDLDAAVDGDPGLTDEFDQAVNRALAAAYGADSAAPNHNSSASSTSTDSPAVLSDRDAAHLFLQRVLYQINRLVLFWFDDLSNYKNERSQWLAGVRDRIERAWQSWELSKVG